MSGVQPAASAAPAGVEIVPLNSSARNVPSEAAFSSAADGIGTPCFVLLDDAWRGSEDLADAFEGMQRPCFGLRLLQVLPLCTGLMMKAWLACCIVGS